jgi:hypothetical protein
MICSNHASYLLFFTRALYIFVIGVLKQPAKNISNAIPSHGFLTDKQVADVLTYVRSGVGNKAPCYNS